MAPLLALEVAFRILGPFLPGDYRLGIEREFDPTLGWRQRANFVGGNRSAEFAARFQTNSLGLRGGEIAYDKPAEGYRVLVLGDSFVAAAHVSLEQTMAHQLGDLLRQDLAPRPAEVINAGVAGYGTSQEYLYLETEGYRYYPDVVVLVVFLGNDLTDNLRSEDARWDRPTFEVGANGQLLQVNRPRRAGDRPGRDDLLFRTSTVYNFVQSGLLAKLDPANTRTGEEGREPGQDFQIYRRAQPQKLLKAWEVTEALIEAIAARCDAIGARLVVAGAPSFRQLDPNRFVQLLLADGVDPADYDPELPSRLLAGVAARERLLYLDLLPVLRQAQGRGEGDVFYPRNTHWAPAGQRAVAEALRAFLLAQGIPEPERAPA